MDSEEQPRHNDQTDPHADALDILFSVSEGVRRYIGQDNHPSARRLSRALACAMECALNTYTDPPDT